jgi:hypothetical protein
MLGRSQERFTSRSPIDRIPAAFIIMELKKILDFMKHVQESMLWGSFIAYQLQSEYARVVV